MKLRIKKRDDSSITPFDADSIDYFINRYFLTDCSNIGVFCELHETCIIVGVSGPQKWLDIFAKGFEDDFYQMYPLFEVTEVER